MAVKEMNVRQPRIDLPLDAIAAGLARLKARYSEDRMRA
jgi:hypothetical protein